MDIAKMFAVLIVPVLLLLGLCWLLLQNRRRRLQAGPLLLSLAAPRRSRYFAAMGIALIVAAAFFNFFPGVHAINYAIRVFLIGGGLSLCNVALFRTEIRDAGIWSGGTLFRWSQIESYHWAENSRQKVIFNLRERIGLQHQLNLPIDPSHRLALEQVFHQKLESIE